MAERLARIAQETNPEKNYFVNARRIEMFRRQEQEAKELADRVRLRMQIGYELALAGQSAEAVENLLTVRTALSQPTVRPSAKTLQQLGELLAMSYLRLGEQENCVAKHSQDSCLMPIQGSGVHTLPRGSRAAIDELSELLKQQPDDLRYRWLLNLAYMTLGEYPDKVPAPFVIPPKLFESDYVIPRFYDVAAQAGLARVALSGGCVTEDLDGDGDIDVMTSSFGLTDQLRYYQNNSDGSFTDRTNEAGILGEVGGLNICHADYDNDGDSDVLVLRGAWMRDQGHIPNSLLRNRGDGYFDDVTEEAGMLSFHPTQAGTWADFDSDGWLDLFIGNESTSGETHPCELFHNNRDGTFTNVAEQVGLAYVSMVKGAAWGDFNNDGRPDLYLSCLSAPNVLFRNDGPVSPVSAESTSATNHHAKPPGSFRWLFTDVTKTAGVAEPMRSFPTWFWDYDNDGWEDILVASFSTFMTDPLRDVVADVLGLPHTGDTPRLYRNKHDGTFSDETKTARLDHVLLAMGANFGDLDNDGFSDCYFGTGDPLLTTLVPNRMFRNADGKVFQDVTTAGGFGHLQKGHAIAFVDLDNDGDQDVYSVMGGAFSGDVFANALFENPGFGNHWLTVRLEGTRSNRSAIGARLKVSLETDAGDRSIYATVSTGGSFGSQSLQQEIGLGQAKSIRSLEVTWPTTGKTQIHTNIARDQVIKIREGDSEVVTVTLKKFDLSPGDAGNADCPHHPK